MQEPGGVSERLVHGTLVEMDRVARSADTTDGES